jgi:GNAT superfamily N-acetyltransferase
VIKIACTKKMLLYNKPQMSNLAYEVLRVTEYSEEIAAGLGRLMPRLDSGMGAEPRSRNEIEKIITDSHRDQFVAMASGLIVGKAYVVDIGEPGWSMAYLGGMVVDPITRGYGVGSALLEATFDWCTEKGITRIGWYSEGDEFHSAAHRLYERHGAQVIAPFFEKVLNLPEPA